MSKGRFSLLLALLAYFGIGQAIGQTQALQGTVSYLSSENVYVRFQSTAGISPGDTLYLAGSGGKLSACLKVESKSSVSCVCSSLQGCRPALGESITALVPVPLDVRQPSPTDTTILPPTSGIDSLQKADPKRAADTVSTRSSAGVEASRLHGLISVAGYNSYEPSSEMLGASRIVTRFSLNLDNIAGKGLSFESYGNYQYNLRTGYDGAGRDQLLGLYSASLSWQVNPALRLRLGRSIQPGLSSLGPFDGLSIQTGGKKWYAGALAGFRPDMADFTFNSNLLQFGAFGGLNMKEAKYRGQSTIGIIEQRNGGSTDRRFLYFQQSSSLGRSLSAFGSVELDLYEHFDTASAKTAFKLSSLYLSATYRPGRKLSFFASYDTRRQVIYFESFSGEIERLLAEQEARQGLRLRANYRLFKETSLGCSYTTRFTGDQGLSSEYIQLSLYQGRLPLNSGSLNYRFSMSRNLHFRTRDHSIHYSLHPAKKEWSFTAFYRYLNLQYALNDMGVKPFHDAGIEFSHSFGSGLDMGVYAEVDIHEGLETVRLNLRITKRFNTILKR